jgi:hypothetical protein
MSGDRIGGNVSRMRDTLFRRSKQLVSVRGSPRRGTRTRLGDEVSNATTKTPGRTNANQVTARLPISIRREERAFGLPEPSVSRVERGDGCMAGSS